MDDQPAHAMGISTNGAQPLSSAEGFGFGLEQMSLVGDAAATHSQFRNSEEEWGGEGGSSVAELGGASLINEDADEDAHLAFEVQLEQLMASFWKDMCDVTAAADEAAGFTQRDLPIARIQRIERQNAVGDPVILTGDSVEIMAFACELFIRSLTVRARSFLEQSGRRTLQQRNLLGAVMSSPKYDFFIDTVHAILADSRTADAAPAERAAEEMES